MCITQHPHYVCPYLCLHIQAWLSVHEFGKVDILCRSKMRAPLVVYSPLGWLISLPANHCCGCHLLHFMFLLYSSLSAPNTFLCVSLLFYLQIPQCHHKKVRRHQSPVDPHVFSDGWHVSVLLCVSAFSIFTNEMKNISWCCWCWFEIESFSVSVTEQSVWLQSQSLTPTDT